MPERGVLRFSWAMQSQSSGLVPLKHELNLIYCLQSGVKDEIDWESTTNNTKSVQTNYYWEGDVAGCSSSCPSAGKRRSLLISRCRRYSWRKL